MSGCQGQHIERSINRVRRRVLGIREFQVYDYVRKVLSIEGMAPSYDMICAETGMDKGNLSKTVASLERRGLLSRVGSGRVRRIRLS